MSGETRSFTSAELFVTAHASSTSLPLSSSSLSSHSPLPHVPSDFPRSKIIPGTRFVIDGFRFSGDFSVSYFLSHFHSDHYAGLSAAWSRGIVFCSDVTARLLEQVFGVCPRFVVRLPLNEPVNIDGCEVTLIDANHCPGAVQFLFKIPRDDRESARYVHTGDFRFCDSMRLDSKLCEFVGCDGVYLDTTYCDPKFLFPSQKESIDYVVGVIESAGTENKNGNKNVLFLVATYAIGKEKILVEISRRCGRKIHVDSKKMAVLRALGYEDDTVFTEDQSATDVRVVGWNVLGETWPYFRPNFISMKDIMVESGYSKVVGFVPTGWTYEVKRNKFAIRTKDMFEIHLVPYSEHSNFSELREYVRFLKPKRVIPTVGSDIENVDSKHAAKMQKHFAGLIDDLANKKEFLIGFKRAAVGKGGRVADDDPCCGATTRAQHEVKVRLSLPDVKHCNENEIEPEDGIFSSALVSDGLNNSSLLSDKEKEEFMQELQHCLPNWVTQDLMHELIEFAGINIVEAVSYFYEHETDFHERAYVSIGSVITSQSDCKDDSSSVPNLDLPESNVLKIVGITKSQNTKFPKLKPSVGSDISPGKRRKNRDDKGKKKTRINSTPESGGKKQSTITNFFTKASPSPGVNPESQIDESCNVKFVTPCDDTMSYKQETEQFIQIIGDSKSLRRYAAMVIEKARGDVNLALDMYYNGSEIKHVDGQAILDKNRKSKLTEVGNQDPSSTSDGKLAAEIRNGSLEATETSTVKKVNALKLPPERYSPGEHACWRYGQPAPYIHLARTFELVEGEKGKIKATSMLCNMFRSLLALSPEDVLPAVYLCTNKIAPDHENMELNIGESLVTGALEEVCGTNKSKIREMYNSLGDLGDVAQGCRQTQSLLIPPSPLLIRDVFSTLQKICMQTGNGSTARKKSLIVGLLRSCREKEIKFLVRTLIRNLRIGAMMRTVLPALAQAVAMNSLASCYAQGTVENLKEKLQSLSTAAVESYNLLPSLDVLVPSLMSKGIEFSSNTLTMAPGIPIRPMLAKITNGVPQVVKQLKNKSFTCEYKYDGQRAQIHKLADGTVRIFSRNGDETTSKFPDVVHIIQDACKSSTVSFILDAEVVAIDRKKGCKLLSFQELSLRERGGKDSSVSVVNIKVDVCVYVFDIMFINGKQLLSCPLRQRRTYLKDLFNDEKPGYIEYAKELTVEADDACEENGAIMSKISAFFEDAFHSSCEGIIAKTLDVDAGYFPSKRADSWLKVKRDYVDGLNDSLDLVPLGAWHGNGRKAGWYSPFLMACYNPDTEEFESVCRVMSGFSDSFYTEMKEFFSGEKIITKKPVYYRTLEMPDVWFSPELAWQIRGADLTISPVHQAAVGLVHPSRGISVRFPRFVCSVTDRRPEDCSTSADIAEMFHSQTRKMEVGTNVRGKNR